MKIALVNNQYQLGGAETVAIQLCQGGRRRGHDVDLHIPWGSDIPLWATAMYPRTLARIEETRFGRIVSTLFPSKPWIERSFRALGTGASELIHVHSFHGIYAPIEDFDALARRKPLVWTMHRFWGVTGGCDHPGECRRYLDQCGECPRVHEWPINGTDNTREQLQKKRDTIATAPITVISPSRHLARAVQASPVGRDWRIEVIPNGTNPVEFRSDRKSDRELRQAAGLPPDGLIVLMVIRDFQDPTKGFDILKTALENLGPAPGVHFCFAGLHSDWAIRQCPAGMQTVDLGYILDRSVMARALEAADIFLFASPGENFPCVTLEAMSSGCCVVSTPTDGVLEQIEDGRSGLFSADFRGDSLAAPLRRALADPRLRRELGTGARRRIESEFTEEQMVDRHLELYRDILESGKVKAGSRK